MKKKNYYSCIGFFVKDVINVTANVDQAQQNIVMTKVLNQFHQIT